MPETAKIIIYIIECRDTGLRYVGKTRTSLKKRLAKHRSRDNSTKSREIIKNGNYIAYEYATFLKGSPEDFEDEIINSMDCVNNKRQKKTSAKARETCRKYVANSPLINCECGRQVKKTNLTRHKLSLFHTIRVN